MAERPKTSFLAALFVPFRWGNAIQWVCVAINTLAIGLHIPEPQMIMLGNVGALLMCGSALQMAYSNQYRSRDWRNWVGEGTGWRVEFRDDDASVYDEAKQWCRENATGRWNIDMRMVCGVAYFSNDRDAVAFRLYFDPPET